VISLSILNKEEQYQQKIKTPNEIEKMLT